MCVYNFPTIREMYLYVLSGSNMVWPYVVVGGTMSIWEPMIRYCSRLPWNLYLHPRFYFSWFRYFWGWARIPVSGKSWNILDWKHLNELFKFMLRQNIYYLTSHRRNSLLFDWSAHMHGLLSIVAVLRCHRQRTFTPVIELW